MLSTMQFKKYFAGITLKAKKVYKKVTHHIDQRPLRSFFSLLALLFLFIIIGNLLRHPPTESKTQPQVKTVTVYRIGQAPRLTVSAQVEKSGVISVTSLTGGVVQNIYVKEGSKVGRGQWLASLASVYGGGNTLTIARQIAEIQQQNVEETYPTQKDVIGKQRDLARQTGTNFEKLRDISAQSVGDTQNVINLNTTIISSLDASIKALQSSGDASASALLLASQQIKSQFLSANLQLNTSLRNAQYQSDSSNPPTQLASTQRDMTLKQLDIAEKALDLNREMSSLQLNLARVNESAMFPSSPFPATVERVFVRVGQSVAPGTPIALLSESIDPQFRATAYVSKAMVDHISRLEPTDITMGSTHVSLYPSYISREAVQGSLYGVTYDLPQGAYEHITDKGFITISLPIGYADTSAAMPFIPVDSVYQTQDEAFVFVVEGGTSKNKKITLGDVYGSYVQVPSGIGAGDMVITNRNVVDGDAVEVK